MDYTRQNFLPLTESTFLILASLASPKHGYAVMQDVTKWSEGKTRLGPGTLYGALTKLLDQGLIQRTDDPEPGDERRKHYVLTPRGRLVVEAECARLEAAALLGRKLLNGKDE
ncbi:MAG: PadR family transcriptional regulator [Bryobacteraceae bacterium]|nr:helix-turn-helix transcriptional regulator [Solibacteraceae bacterium]MCL4842492.1 PadR family transcriptional regulator [Bryobacteraceae bacterium]MCO5350902.1 PadR family transcriptional regulator [Bryobacteraceae bacterium]